jgi:hypothetical protein
VDKRALYFDKRRSPGFVSRSRFPRWQFIDHLKELLFSPARFDPVGDILAVEFPAYFNRFNRRNEKAHSAGDAGERYSFFFGESQPGRIFAGFIFDWRIDISQNNDVGAAQDFTVFLLPFSGAGAHGVCRCDDPPGAEAFRIAFAFWNKDYLFIFNPFEKFR